MLSSLSTTLHSFFGGGSTNQGDSLGGLLRKVLPIPGGEEEGPEDQFASWLPYSAYIPEERLFVNRETLGFMLEVVPQSGADERMAEILVSLYATCPPGTGIQWMLFGSPHVLDCLSQYGNLRVEDADQGEKAKHYGRPARNTNLYRTLARRRVAHLLQGAHASLTKGYHYTVRDFKLSLSVCVAGSIDNMTMRENLLLLRESISTTLRAASFPNRVCTADDLINWCALFCNPHRIEAPRLTPLHYDDGREIRDQIIDFDTLQEARPLGLVFTKPGRDEAVETRFYSIKSFPEHFALWQMNGLIGDLMQPALQYSCPFLITMGVQILDPTAMRTIVTANHVRATQNAKSKMAEVMPDVSKKLEDWKAAARHPRPGWPDRESVPPAGDLHPAERGHHRRRERQSDLARPRLRAQQRHLHAPAGAHGLPADDALREAAQRHAADAPRLAQDRCQRHPFGARHRRVARDGNPDADPCRPPRPVDDA